MHKYEALKEMCETLTQELERTNSKVNAAGGKITMEDIKYIDPLVHAIKSVDTSLAMIEAKEGGSYNMGHEHDNSYRSYNEDGDSHRYVSQWDENASERGRGRYAKRDSMGRYASYEGPHDDMRR